MGPKLRKVTGPGRLEELWNDEGTVEATRGDYLGVEQIRELLRNGPVQFVETKWGRMRWVPLEERFDFWRAELRDRVVETPERFYLDDYRDHYCYLVSHWRVPGQPHPVVLAEMWH